MKYFFVLFLVISFLSACKHEKKVDEDFTPKSNAVHQTIDATGCYQLLVKPDTAFMQIKKSDSIWQWIGELAYHPKSGNVQKGKVSLNQDGQYLVGCFEAPDYAGKITCTQKIFRIQTNGLAEGFGEMYLSNDSAFYNYPHNLSFKQDFPFKKINCQ